jgi:hypothetical protein
MKSDVIYVYANRCCTPIVSKIINALHKKWRALNWWLVIRKVPSTEFLKHPTNLDQNSQCVYVRYEAAKVPVFQIGLMFVPCIIRRSRNNQRYALICITPLIYILAPTCFGSSLPSSGSFLDPSALLEIQIEWVVYHIMCGYVVCVPESRGYVCCAYQLPVTTTLRHTGHVTTHYMIYHLFDLYFK